MKRIDDCRLMIADFRSELDKAVRRYARSLQKSKFNNHQSSIHPKTEISVPSLMPRILQLSVLLGLLLTLSVSAATTPVDPYAAERRPSPGHTSYHIDPVSGDDHHNGLTPTTAWKSFEPVNRLTLAPGDRVDILSPGPFHHTLALAGSGSAAEPIAIHFAPGRYDVHPTHLRRVAYHISNTNDEPDVPKAVAILLAGTQHIRLTGPGAALVCRGKMIEVCIDGSEDVMVSDLTFDYHRPTVSEFRITATSETSADLAIHADSAYSIENRKLTWQGEGWADTTGLAQELDPTTGVVRRRSRDPLAGLTIEEISPFLLRARGHHNMRPGLIYQIRDTRRDCAGVFVRDSRDITWRAVTFRFLHGMGLVHQFSENLTFDTVTIAPDPARGRTTAAWADCLHLSGCKGTVRILNSTFSGSHDDALNIHGTYLRAVGKISDHQLRVRFMHPQTFGFPAFHPGDDIEILHSDTMAAHATNRVREARLENPQEMLLTLEHPVPASLGPEDVVENITWNPAVEIRGCKVSHIPTHGFLITSRRSVLVEDNEFTATYMSALHVGADARSWFESGGVRDMTLRNNRFLRCGEPVIHIRPRTSAPNPAVHQNIRIENNTFVLRDSRAIAAHSTRGLHITNNSFLPATTPDIITTHHCEDVITSK
jgi:hypothetical protein